MHFSTRPFAIALLCALTLPAFAGPKAKAASFKPLQPLAAKPGLLRIKGIKATGS